jgi:hypothetical protein
MNLDIETLFPDGLTDETASAISDVLQELTLCWESRYLHQIRRYHDQRQADLFDPEQPWRRKTRDD